jgi:membrane fusion protein
MNDLFRKQALQHKSQGFHGVIMLTRTWSYPALCLFFSCIVLAILVFAMHFGFTRKETVSGMLVPDHGLIRLQAPQAGVLTGLYVSEGQAVQAGQALFALSGEVSSAQGNTQENIKQSLALRISHLDAELLQQTQQSKNKAQELQQRIDNLSVSLQQLAQELAAQRRRIQLIADVNNRISELAKTGIVSKVAANEKAAELIEQESRLATLQQQEKLLQRERSAAQASLSDVPLVALREASQIQREREQLKQQMSESEAKRELVIRAGQAGTIAGLLVARGQSVSADQVLASVLPGGSSLEVELYAPTRAAGFVQLGTPVLLRYEAYPYQKFGQFRGKVREISANTINLAELQATNNSTANGNKTANYASEPVYRIRVQLEAQQVAAFGQLHQLKPGMQLSASLVLEQRTLAEWALEPLYGMARQ